MRFFRSRCFQLALKNASVARAFFFFLCIHQGSSTEQEKNGRHFAISWRFTEKLAVQVCTLALPFREPRQIIFAVKRLGPLRSMTSNTIFYTRKATTLSPFH
uniref:Putative secreted protein n=1 Tax=Ixodes ricinus TaxID=34613 RepID=A0A6B0U6Z5_IXORI